MKKIVFITAIVTSLIAGCSNGPRDFVEEERFKEDNKPFLTPYQVVRAQTTMVKLDKTNDQVEIVGGSEYVFWQHDYPSANEAKKVEVPVAAVATEKKFPFTTDEIVNGCSQDDCKQKTKTTAKKANTDIIYDIGECEGKGCD
jgi:hypothetical protein